MKVADKICSENQSVAVMTLSAYGGLEIRHIDHNLERVYFVESYGDSEGTSHYAKIHFAPRDYFVYNGTRYYLDDFMRLAW